MFPHVRQERKVIFFRFYFVLFVSDWIFLIKLIQKQNIFGVSIKYIHQFIRLNDLRLFDVYYHIQTWIKLCPGQWRPPFYIKEIRQIFTFENLLSKPALEIQ